MLATLQELKEALGIDAEDVSNDALCNRSLATANALIAGYIGTDLSDTSTEHSHTAVLDTGACYVTLPLFPVVDVTSVLCEGEAVTDFVLRPRSGMVDFPSGLPASDRFGHRVAVTYLAGFEEIPTDLNMACLNMAAGLYNLGGTFASATSGGTGELKALTMFDAMSMTFDTSSSNSNEEAPGTPAGMIKAWEFILKKYQCKTPVMR